MADLFKEKRPLVIESPESGRRLIAELFPAQDYTKTQGIIFFDIGWYGSPAHPVHIIAGTVQGDGPWEIPEADAEISVLGSDDDLQDEWQAWQEFIASDAGKGATRALAEQILQDGAY